MLRKQARQTIVDHSASSWYSPDPSHEPASEHNEDSACAPSLLNLQAPKGDRTAQGMVGISGASLQKQLLEGSGENTWAPCHWRAPGVPRGSPSLSGSGLRAEGLSGFTEIELGTAPKRQQSQPAPFSTCRSHSSVGSTPDDAAAPRGTFTLQAASAYVVVVHRVKACTSGEGLLPASSAPARLRWARPAQARTGDQCFHGHHGTES